MSRWSKSRVRLLPAIVALATVLPLLCGLGSARATPTDLFFSEYIEGTSNNKALEIYNGTGAAVNLAAGAYDLQMFFNGSVTAGLTLPPPRCGCRSRGARAPSDSRCTRPPRTTAGRPAWDPA